MLHNWYMVRRWGRRQNHTCCVHRRNSVTRWKRPASSAGHRLCIWEGPKRNRCGKLSSGPEGRVDCGKSRCGVFRARPWGTDGSPAAGRSCIAARSRTRARMTLALNLAMGRAGRGAPGPGGDDDAPAGGSCTAPLPPTFRHHCPRNQRSPFSLFNLVSRWAAIFSGVTFYLLYRINKSNYIWTEMI